ncbi:MAG: hypothetical protein DI626_10840, partial [Micavibrio aeruginosavorus]
VPPNDADALAKALEEALSMDAEARSVMATHAMMHIAENFTRSKMVDETMDVYAELLQEKFFVAPPKKRIEKIVLPETTPLNQAAE